MLYWNLGSKGILFSNFYNALKVHYDFFFQCCVKNFLNTLIVHYLFFLLLFQSCGAVEALLLAVYNLVGTEN